MPRAAWCDVLPLLMLFHGTGMPAEKPSLDLVRAAQPRCWDRKEAQCLCVGVREPVVGVREPVVGVPHYGPTSVMVV